jgi:hypothetical protein
MEAACMHVWAHIEHLCEADGALSSNLVSYISLFKEIIIVTNLADVTRPLLSLYTVQLDSGHRRFPVAMVVYQPWLYSVLL